MHTSKVVEGRPMWRYAHGTHRLTMFGPDVLDTKERNRWECRIEIGDKGSTFVGDSPHAALDGCWCYFSLWITSAPMPLVHASMEILIAAHDYAARS